MPTLFLSDTTYTRLTDLVPHPYRKSPEIYYTLQKANPDQIARGISKYLESVFCHKHAPRLDMPRPRTWPRHLPHSPDPAYYHTIKPNTYPNTRDLSSPAYLIPLNTNPHPYTIYKLKPDTFLDARPTDLTEHQIQLGAIPGQNYDWANPEHPIWTTGDEDYGRPHIFQFPNPSKTQAYPEILDACYAIALYWHIPSVDGTRLKSRTSAASAVLEALGQGLLRHIYLPIPPRD